MKILLAEDDQRLGKLIMYKLKQEYDSVDWVQDGEAAYDYAITSPYEILILDWMMPKMDGISVSKKLRQAGYHGGILMLTANDEVPDRVYGLESGCDDYLTKPFEFSELIARLRALSRRSIRLYQDSIIQIQDLHINQSTHEVLIQNQLIELTPREYQLLLLLAKNANFILSKEVIIDAIWGIDQYITTNTIEAFIGSIRKKLDADNPKKYIQTIRSAGYKLVK